MYQEVVSAVVWILPAYVANGAPVLTVHILRKLSVPVHPIDLGVIFLDGRRLLGDNKTIEGFVGGLVAGTAVGALMQALSIHSMFQAFILSFGALFGDLAGAFIKRRLGLRPGAPAPLLDQLDFVAGAIAFYALYAPISIEYIAIIASVTPLLHLAANAVAYFLRLKRVPW